MYLWWDFIQQRKKGKVNSTINEKHAIFIDIGGAATVQFNEAYGSLPNTCGMTNIAALKELQASISYDSITGLKADPVYDTITGIQDNVPTDTATN